ncbi:MAG: Crp/Fnr family transcriptional regulator [Parvularculaceae bacterium]|nr:Crp/Fnr family transcriptional regulator [Parvularculaceae bacterium]
MSATQLVPTSDDAGTSELVKGATLFGDLPHTVLEALAGISRRRFYSRGEPVFALGQFDGAEFYFVASGRLKAAIADSNGSMLFEDVAAGQFFALAEAVASVENSRAHKATLTAEEDSEVLSVDSAAFLEIVAQRPSLTRKLMQHFALALATGVIQSAPSETTPERRVFAVLMRYVERDTANGDWRIPRMPKHRELAEASGVDEPAAAAAIALLIQEGVAKRDYPGLIISDMNRFGKLAA